MGRFSITISNQKMKLVAISAALGMAAAAAVPSEFAQFKAKFGKTYKSAAEEQRKMAVFKENMAYIARHNLDHAAGKESYTVGVNQFADLTNAEFRSQHLAEMVEAPQIRLNYQCPVAFSDNGSTNPDSVDWRSTDNPLNKVAVTSVKDQGSCGSCWSFGGAAAFEGAMCTSGQQDCTSWSGASDHTTTWLATVAGSTTPSTTSSPLVTSTATIHTHTYPARPKRREPASPTPPTLAVASATAVPPPRTPKPNSPVPSLKSDQSVLLSMLAELASSFTVAASMYPTLAALLD